MEIVYALDAAFRANEYVATVGFFDGVHAGHRFLIEELKNIAAEQGRKSLVFTFSEHPRKILHSDFQPALITTLEEKLFQLGTTGVDACVVLDFTLEMSMLSAYQFLYTILFSQYSVRTLLVGHDHRFGHNRAEGFADYKKYGQEMGLEVVQAQRYSTSEFTHISSSEIRQALLQGDVLKANKLLTYTYSFEGEVIGGFKVGRKIGFPTANLKPFNTEKLIPGTGVYAVTIKWKADQLKGMMNIGLRPTLDNGKSVSFEINIFDFDKDIYNERLEVSFIQKIRDEQKFDGIDALIEQLNRDKQTVLEVLG